VSRLPPDPESAEGFSLTPMIDVTFQLLIFFMLVTDMTKTPLELEMPRASMATEVKENPQRLTLDVDKTGRIRANGRIVFNPGREAEPERLVDLLEARRAGSRYGSYPLLIRADAESEFQHLQRILMIATQHGGVVTIELGAVPE
jgi:biopolymer transport protein ExbD